MHLKYKDQQPWEKEGMGGKKGMGGMGEEGEGIPLYPYRDLIVGLNDQHEHEDHN